jgi:2'-5' RNA ligase
VRLFLGIPLADAVLTELTRLTARLHSAATSLRWSAPESWHITLQFLGNTTQEQYGCLIVRLAEVHFPPLPVQLAATGTFDRAGIFYAGVELTPQLAALQQRIVAATAPCGFEPESRPYHPHITLARSKSRSHADELRALESRVGGPPKFPRFTAREFLLYESHLSSSGSTYEVRDRFPRRVSETGERGI